MTCPGERQTGWQRRSGLADARQGQRAARAGRAGTPLARSLKRTRS